MSGTSGRTSQVPFAFYDPASSSWRMFGATLDGGSLPFSGTLPTSGSMRNGELYERPTSALLISANGCSSPQLLGTPRTSSGNGPGDLTSRRNQTRLETQVALLKTPTAQLAINGGSQHPDKRRAGGHGPTLADEVEFLLPTPTASNPNDGESLQSWEDRRQRNLAKGINGNGQGTPLGVAVRLLPTPRATDGTNGGPNQRGSSGDLMPPSAVQPGALTHPPSAVGSTSSDDLLPGQLSLDDLASD
jgi:hypothetical protein